MNKLLKPKELTNLITKNLKKGQILFRENDECKYVGIVIKGELEIKSNLSTGKEIIYNNIKEGKMFGHNLIFSANNYYLADVKAKIDSKVILIDKNELLKILKTNQIFLEEYLKYGSNSTIELNKKIKLLSFELAEDRLIYYLSINNNKIEFQSITALSKELSLQRETTSRLITKLIKNKRIARNSNSIKLIN